MASMTKVKEEIKEEPMSDEEPDLLYMTEASRFWVAVEEFELSYDDRDT